MEEKKDKFEVNFEEFGIKFTDEDFEGVSKETLIKCREKIDKLLEKIENME